MGDEVVGTERMERKLQLDELVLEFVETPHWQASEELVRTHGELLTPDADTSLRGMLEVASARADARLTGSLQAHQAVLRRCREVGVAPVFSELSGPGPASPGWFTAQDTASAKIDGVRRRYCDALNTIATALRGRFQETGRGADLEIAAKMHLSATTLFRGSSEQHAELLDGLALDLALQYKLTSTSAYLDGAIEAWGAAVKLKPASPEYAADYRQNLANMLQARYALQRNPADLLEAVALLREAIGMTEDGTERHARIRSSLDELERATSSAEVATASAGAAAENGTLQQLIAGAQALSLAGRYAPAAEAWRRALAIFESFGAGARPEAHVLHSNIGEAEYKLGHPREAVESFTRALELLGGPSGGDQLATAHCLNNLGAAYFELKEYASAEQHLNAALEIWRQLADSERDARDGLAASLMTLGSIRVALADYDEAERLYREALGVWAELGGSVTGELGRCLADLAELHRTRGEYARAEPLYRRALELARAEHGEQHPDYAAVQQGLGLLYAEWGETKRAVSLLRSALAIRVAALGPQHPHTSSSLNSLGLLLQKAGRLRAGRELLTRALAARRGAVPADAGAVARTLNNLALGYEMEGRLDEAARLLEESLELRRGTYGPLHPHVASCLIHLSTVRGGQGRYEEAEASLREALDIYRRSSLENHPAVVGALTNLAAVHAAAGRPGEALNVMQRSMLAADRLMRELFSVGSEAQRMAYLEDAHTQLSLLLSVLWRHLAASAGEVRTAMKLVMAHKGLGLEVLVRQRNALREGQHERLRPRVKELLALRARIARETLAVDDPIDAATRKERLESLGEQLRTLEGELAAQIPEMRLDLDRVNVDTVARALPADSALVEIVRFGPFEFAAWLAAGKSPVLPERYLAFVLASGAPEHVALVDLGEADTIDELVRSFRDAVAGQPAGSRDLAGRALAGVTEERHPGSELRQRVLDPLGPHLLGRRRLFIAPDGALSLVPFEALPIDRDRHVIDDYVISYVAVARDLLRLSQPTPAAGGVPIVIADPDFDLVAPRSSAPADPTAKESRVSRELSHMRLRFRRLDGVRREGEAIAALLGVAARTRENALERTLKSADSPRILHIASHGFFLQNQETRPQSSERMLLAGDESQLRLMTRIEDPLLRSGLALAGANSFLEGHSLPVDAEDGLLTAEDVTAMELSGTELVVLSACDTGLGDVRVGEGVFGLRRAFDLAGAKTMVISLWKVPDEQTRELMVHFYELLLRGLPRVEALRTAQRSLKAKYPAVVHWGGFVCQGVPGPLERVAHDQVAAP